MCFVTPLLCDAQNHTLLSLDINGCTRASNLGEVVVVASEVPKLVRL
jgi:hypothetical protein